MHGGWHAGAHQQQAVPITGCRHRRRVRNRIEQASREVHSSAPHRFLCRPVRQAPHATVLLRLYRQVRRTTAVPVLRNGHRFAVHCASRRDHRRSHHFRTPRALLPPQIRIVAGRMLRRARGRVRPGPTGWLDARGRPLSRVVSHARRSTRGHPVC